MNLTFITSNPSKAAFVSEFLEHPIGHKSLDLAEVQSLDLEEVTCCKAQEAFRILKTPVLVEDISLVFHALNQLPGPLIKWFLQSIGNDGICNLLNQYEDRSATAEVRFCLYDGEEIHMFKGLKKGEIAAAPRGEKGFGWDPIFIPEGFTQTWGEMDTAEQFASSMRQPAISELRTYLDAHWND
jgi:inosine triphosphate pyrophosphatase